MTPEQEKEIYELADTSSIVHAAVQMGRRAGAGWEDILFVATVQLAASNTDLTGQLVDAIMKMPPKPIVVPAR